MSPHGWGQPYDAYYAETSEKYLACECAVMLEVIENIKQATQPLVIDTTGSVIYLERPILDQIKSLTKVVYLQESENHVTKLYERYITNPKPVYWGKSYAPLGGEKPDEAMKRCFLELRKLFRTLSSTGAYPHSLSTPSCCRCDMGKVDARLPSYRSMKILFITSNRLGDAVLSQVCWRGWFGNIPMRASRLSAAPMFGSVCAVPNLERLIILEKQTWNRHWLGLWRECVGTRWDMVIDFRNSIVSRLLRSKLSAYGGQHSGQHKVVEHAAILGISLSPAPHVWLDAAAEAEAAKLIPLDRKILALARRQLGVQTMADWKFRSSGTTFDGNRRSTGRSRHHGCGR